MLREVSYYLGVKFVPSGAKLSTVIKSQMLRNELEVNRTQHQEVLVGMCKAKLAKSLKIESSGRWDM